MQIHKKGYSIYVLSDIIVEHQSVGNQNSQWLKAAYIFYNKWKNDLPDTVNPDFKLSCLTNIKGFKNLLYLHKINKYSVSKETLKIGWKRLRLNILTAYLFYIGSRIKNKLNNDK
jgi:hypothetical protein